MLPCGTAIGVTVSVGAEIGEVGHKNSTVEELHAFMEWYNRTMAATGRAAGISKISVQTGTSHGGVVLPDGSIAEKSVSHTLAMRGVIVDVDELRAPTTSAYAALDARDEEIEGDDE